MGKRDKRKKNDKDPKKKEEKKKRQESKAQKVRVGRRSFTLATLPFFAMRCS